MRSFVRLSNYTAPQHFHIAHNSPGGINRIQNLVHCNGFGSVKILFKSRFNKIAKKSTQHV